MKKYITILLIQILALSGNSQTISPLETSEFCPGTDVTFTVTIPGTNPSVISWTNAPILVQGAYNITSSGANTTFDFRGRFNDVNINQVFRVNYTNSSGNTTVKDFEFKRIKSLFYGSCNLIQPNQPGVTAAMCQIVAIPISFNNVQWKTEFESPQLCFGIITNYEYLLPSGWSLNSTTSNGTNWITGSNNVTLTSDLGTGDGATIQVRPANNGCGTGLKTGQSAVIQITRPVNLSISGAASFCSGSSTYTLNGLPPSSTVSWSVNNTNTATIPNPSTGTSVVVTKVSDGVVSLTATVTLCNGQTRTVSKDIVLGAYAYGTYQYTSNYGNGTNALGSANSHFIPANQTMSFMINLGNTDFSNITWTSTGSYSVNPVPNGFGGCSFYMVSAPTAYATRTATLTINATGPCGTVNRSFNFTLITQGWGFRMQMSPNPASDNLIVSLMDESTDVKTLDKAESVILTLYDINKTNIVKQWKFQNNQTRFNLNVVDVKLGHYVLVVQKGKYQQSEQIFIE